MAKVRGIHIAIRNNEQCVYCGTPAAHWDHFVPKKYRPDYIQNVMLASCSECNLIVGANIFETFLEKQKFIQNKLQLKYENKLIDSKLARRLTWTNEQNSRSASLATLRLHLNVSGNDFVLKNVKRSLKIKNVELLSLRSKKKESPPCRVCGSRVKRKRHRILFCSSTCELKAS